MGRRRPSHQRGWADRCTGPRAAQRHAVAAHLPLTGDRRQMTVTRAMEEPLGVWLYQGPRYPSHTKPRRREAAGGSAGIPERHSEPRLAAAVAVPGPAPLLCLSAIPDHFQSWKEGSKRLLAGSLKTKIKPAASRSCRGAGDSVPLVRVVGLGGESQDPKPRPFRGGDSPACARRRQATRDTPKPAVGRPLQQNLGWMDKGCDRRDQRRPGERGVSAWGWDLLLLWGAAPLSSLQGGEGRGKRNRPQCPAEAPVPPLQPLPPHSPAPFLLFRSLSVPVSMVTASGRSLQDARSMVAPPLRD